MENGIPLPSSAGHWAPGLFLTRPTPGGGGGGGGGGGTGGVVGHYGVYTGSYYVAPVVLDLSGNGINITPVTSSNQFFDMTGDGYQNRTAWAGPGNGVLVIDLSGVGNINNPRDFEFTKWDFANGSVPPSRHRTSAPQRIGRPQPSRRKDGEVSQAGRVEATLRSRGLDCRAALR
jgi:hypothetical protein